MKRRDPAIVLGVALAARLAIVLWGASAFPPAADGAYYHALAMRLADGQGYTWRWPDGVVTYAAHYPVGYPAMIALGYALFGAKPVVAMAINAVLGAGAALATWSLLDQTPARGEASVGARRLALLGGLAVALHPALVPYTAALMTEGVTTAIVVIAGALAGRARRAKGRALAGWLLASGVAVGLATLVRPQSIALAPALGLLGAGALGWKRAGALAAALTAVALAVCAPWTARNCKRMEKCALVSVNGGWNLAIGTQTEKGGWQEIAVPEACKTVFQEAAKDTCFGVEARKAIARDPIGWLARAPAKLRVTFDYFGAAPWYLHESNKERFSYEAKVALGAVETIAARLLLAAALVAVLRVRRSVAGWLVGGVGLVACVLWAGVIGYLALGLAILLLGRDRLRRAPLVVPLTAAVIALTALTHAVFFGAGRYGLVVIPFVAAVAFWRSSPAAGDSG